jgi:hypothetical protein
LEEVFDELLGMVSLAGALLHELFDELFDALFGMSSLARAPC